MKDAPPCPLGVKEKPQACLPACLPAWHCAFTPYFGRQHRKTASATSPPFRLPAGQMLGALR